MTFKCVECGRMTLKLNADKKCEQCARKDEPLKSYFTKLAFINESCAKLVPAN